MSDDEKVLTYEEAKQMCLKAFNAGALYGGESIRYGVNATAYAWEHWLKKNESLFEPKPTVEDVLREMLCAWEDTPTGEGADGIIAEYAKRLTLAEDVSA